MFLFDNKNVNNFSSDFEKFLMERKIVFNFNESFNPRGEFGLVNISCTFINIVINKRYPFWLIGSADCIAAWNQTLD